MPTLDWIGKQAVVNHHREVPYRLIHCDSDHSAGDPETGNLLVQGDNLEALRALLPYYAGKVKCIYIDPPYNTGNEGWVYNDNLSSPEIKAWLGKAVGKQLEDLSRHDKWLCMMYPRLRLLRDFLREDGAIFVSIDDNEVANLRLLMDEVFGLPNFVAEMVWEGAFKNDARQIGVNHEYVLVYGKDRSKLPREWGVEKEAVEPVLREVRRLKKQYGDDYKSASEDLAGWFRANKAKPSFAHRRFRFIDKRGNYKEDDPTAPGGRKFDLINKKTNRVIPLRPNRGWAFDQDTFDNLVVEGRISFVTENSIMVRRYLHETDKVTPQSVFYQPARSASERLATIIGSEVFEYPKDEMIIKQFLEMATGLDDIVMDSFAGSGTTAHATLALNKQDGGNRRFILVEMDENVAKNVTAKRLCLVGEGYNKNGDPTKPEEGLGGGFRYCELGTQLFDEFGDVASEVTFPDLAAHIFFSETGVPIPQRAQSELLGTNLGRAVYLLFDAAHAATPREAVGNVLTPERLENLPDLPEGFEGTKVIYAEGCTVSEARLKATNAIFKQIPYQVEGN